MSEAAVEAVEWRRKETPTSARTESGDAGTEILGVYQLLGGAYGASIWDRSSQTQVRLGTFHSAEDASTAYGAAAAANLARPRSRKDAARPEPGSRTRIRGAHRLQSGAYGSSIRDPSSRTRVWLGSFSTAEDAARAYAAAAAKLPAGARKWPKFRGVRRVTRTGGKYGARITHSKGSQVWLGTFESAEEAARAYDAAAVKLHGDRAYTNFGPDSSSVVLGTQQDDLSTAEWQQDDLSTEEWQQDDLSTAEWQQVHELLKDMDSTDDKEALIDAAAILHQIAQAGNGDGGRGEPT